MRDLKEGQSVGLIDDQLRVALWTSRFVIADLTHGSNGSYWDAGFVEGVGRPSSTHAAKRNGKSKERILIPIIWRRSFEILTN
ncbi:MAG TPA: hypothetical protein VIE66_04155 [Methylocella sp.]